MKITPHSISSCRDTFQCWAILRVRDKYPSVISQGIYSPICESSAPYISLYHQFSKVKQPSLVFNYGSQSKTNSQRTDQRITVLSRFFHETCPFFKGFERTGTCDSLILKHWKNRNRQFLKNSKNRPTLVWRSTFVHFWVEKEINQSNWSARRFERRERRDDSGETKSGGGRLRSDERKRESEWASGTQHKAMAAMAKALPVVAGTSFPSFFLFLPVVLHRRIPCFASHGLRLPAAAARIPCSLTPSPCHPPPPPPRRSFVVKSQSDGGQYISLSPSLYPLLLTWDFAFGIPSSLQALSVTVLWIYDLKFYWWTYILYEYVRGKEKTKAL